MADITLRTGPTGKGAPLSLEQVDLNFTNINTELGLKLDAVNYTATDVLAKILTVDSDIAGINATTLKSLDTASTVPTTGTKETIVKRDTSGNFSGATITATTLFAGNLTGNVTGNLTGNADTATKLTTARNINGVAFDGTAAITVFDSTKVQKTGDTMTGDLTLNYTVNPVTSAAKLAVNKEYVDKYGVPQGTIVMWSGTALPDNMVGIWGLCDGTVEGGVSKPDLRNRFVYGAASFAGVRTTGGSNTVTTSTAGSHNHTGATSRTRLSAGDWPEHTHDFYDVYALWGDRPGNYRIEGGLPVFPKTVNAGANGVGFKDKDGNFVEQYFYYSNAVDGDNDGAAYAFKNVTLPNEGAGDSAYTTSDLLWDFAGGSYDAGTDARVDLYSYYSGMSTPSIGASGYVMTFGYSSATSTGPDILRTFESVAPFVLTTYNKITYQVNKGTSSDWGEVPDSNNEEEIRFDYSLDRVTWYNLKKTFPKDVAANIWTTIDVTIPTACKGAAGVYLRYSQPRNGGASPPRDTWAATSPQFISTVVTPTAGHLHSISSDGSHNHTVSGILPPYYTLAYIIKLI
jgi:hypothetical protein